MSFFNDFLKCLSISDISEKLTISLILNDGCMVVGNFKLSHISDDSIFLAGKKEKINIVGENLMIQSIAKGEIIVSGKVKKIETL